MKLRLEPDDVQAIATAVAQLLQPRPPSELLRLDECGVPVRTLRAAIKAGKLAAMKVGREYRVRRSDLDGWLTERRVTPGSRPTKKLSAAERAVQRAQNAGGLRVVGGS